MEAEIFLRQKDLDDANRRLRAANEELARLYEKTKELDQLKTEFFANISHEFRTPLTLLLGPLEDLLAQETESGERREQLNVIHRYTLRLLRLVNTLLDFSRIEGGRVQPVYEATDLAAFTTDLASQFRSACERAGLRLVVDCHPLPEPAYVDREMWEKVVLTCSPMPLSSPSKARSKCTCARPRAPLN
jgi:signal transduction histidine kinase